MLSTRGPLLVYPAEPGSPTPGMRRQTGQLLGYVFYLVLTPVLLTISSLEHSQVLCMGTKLQYRDSVLAESVL